MENKKTKAKNYYKTNKVKLQKDLKSIIEIFLKIKKIKKEKLLNHLIKYVEELEDVSLNK